MSWEHGIFDAALLFVAVVGISGANGVALAAAEPPLGSSVPLDSIGADGRSSFYEPFDDNPEFPEDVNLVSTFDIGRLARARSVGRKDTWAPKVGPRGLAQWTDRLLVWPQHKFAFCWMDKNAGTQFNHLMNKLNVLHDRTVVWWGSNTVALNVSLDSVTRDNGWRFATFLRDPAERLLSAWSSKCQSWEDAGVNCMGYDRARTVPQDNAVRNFDDMARTYLPLYMTELANRSFFNAHYDPQHLFCGGKALSDYDFVGHLSGGYKRIHSQVRAMLKDVAQVPSKHHIWTHVDKLFPVSAPKPNVGGGVRAAGALGHATGMTLSKLQAFYRNQHTFYNVVTAYAEDYKRFEMPLINHGQR